MRYIINTYFTSLEVVYYDIVKIFCNSAELMPGGSDIGCEPAGVSLGPVVIISQRVLVMSQHAMCFFPVTLPWLLAQSLCGALSCRLLVEASVALWARSVAGILVSGCNHKTLLCFQASATALLWNSGNSGKLHSTTLGISLWLGAISYKNMLLVITSANGTDYMITSVVCQNFTSNFVHMIGSVFVFLILGDFLKFATLTLSWAYVLIMLKSIPNRSFCYASAFRCIMFPGCPSIYPSVQSPKYHLFPIQDLD